MPTCLAKPFLKFLFPRTSKQSSCQRKTLRSHLSVALDSFLFLFLFCHIDNPSVAPGVRAPHAHSVPGQPGSAPCRRRTVCAGAGLILLFPCRALRVRKKMSGEKMPVKMIGDILTAQLPHMQPYIRFCSCQLNGAALIQQKTDEAPDFKEFVKVKSLG